MSEWRQNGSPSGQVRLCGIGAQPPEGHLANDLMSRRSDAGQQVHHLPVSVGMGQGTRNQRPYATKAAMRNRSPVKAIAEYSLRRT